jgi:methylated-DNA-[protein]-cysteine S-methyltransferase
MAAGVIDPLRWDAIPTPIGDLIVVLSDNGVVATTFDEADETVDPALERVGSRLARAVRRSARPFGAVRREVDGYFRGTRRHLETPVDLTLAGEGFGRRVLEATMRIPFGELATYGDVAAAAGSRRGGRAAGNALGRCPIELWVPCHRVVHAGGGIGGYGRHEERKRFLLRHEGAL